VDLHNLKVFYVTEAGKSLALLPVEQDIKDAIYTVTKHLNRKYGMPVTEVRFRFTKITNHVVENSEHCAW
jgi:hypothetical protein